MPVTLEKPAPAPGQWEGDEYLSEVNKRWPDKARKDGEGAPRNTITDIGKAAALAEVEKAWREAAAEKLRKHDEATRAIQNNSDTDDAMKKFQTGLLNSGNGPATEARYMFMDNGYGPRAVEQTGRNWDAANTPVLPIDGEDPMHIVHDAETTGANPKRQ